VVGSTPTLGPTETRPVPASILKSKTRFKPLSALRIQMRSQNQRSASSPAYRSTRNTELAWSYSFAGPSNETRSPMNCRAEWPSLTPRQPSVAPGQACFRPSQRVQSQSTLWSWAASSSAPHARVCFLPVCAAACGSIRAMQTLVHRAVGPNSSLEPTRYGRHCKAGLRHTVHHLRPALHCLPPRAAQLER
jgi:hypothetical protein